MIKLNNKNITYVALADSNNSLKAPKEIWYADSNNSVKLVYRRKDALIEGEDYEKYHWLIGDADAYINTLKYYRPYDDSVQMTFRDNLYPNRESKYNKYNQEENIWGACDGNSQHIIIRSYIGGNTLTVRNNVINGSTAESDVVWGYYIAGLINASPEHSLYISSVDANTDKYYFIYNGNTKNNLPTRYTLPELVQQDVRIFASGAYSKDCFNGSFFNFIHYRNNVEITHLIPCKLLKPVPKWLDANGIRRQVGECGMIDLASGKFYGNVNSTGTFTVENYYERKEWLVGDGSAYIDTLITDLSVSDYIKTIFDDSANLVEPMKKRTWGREGEGKRLIVGNDNYSNRILVWGTDNFFVYYNGGNYVYDMYFDLLNNKVTVNNQIFNLSVPHGNDGMSLALFARHLTASTFDVINRAKFKSFEIHNQINLIPCTLTMDLPASMDANNIARTKGTSGMWDLVSDKFYGNVANSGTFKAVNLAEGVDYEVHDWLVGDGSAYIDTLIYDLTGKSIYCKLERNAEITDWTTTRILGREGDSRFVVTYANISYTTNITLWTQNRSYAPHFTTTEGWIRINFEDNLVETHQSSESIETYTIKSSNLSIILFGDRLSTTTVSRIYKGKIGQLTVNQAMNLIPVKLLKAISSKYDANGIARQAGECGMYDTVNDVFYGNIASSGTFSVSDN